MSKQAKVALSLSALALFAAGIYLAIVVAKPPPPPDFSQLSRTDRSAKGLRPEGLRVENSAEQGTSSEPSSMGSPTAASGLAPVDSTAARPRVAIIIDDLGRSVREVEILLAMGAELTYAVLPFESRTQQVVEALRGRGAELLCHLPMEAKGGANPGPGALRLSMSAEELRAATRHALAAVPGAVGVNNHMGSGISAHREAISAVLGEVAESRLFYLDSRTSADTLGLEVARSLGLPSAERQVFLDSDRDPEAIREQFERLFRLARRDGAAIAIAHPHAVTLEVMALEIPLARSSGIEFVRASRLMH